MISSFGQFVAFGILTTTSILAQLFSTLAPIDDVDCKVTTYCDSKNVVNISATVTHNVNLSYCFPHLSIHGKTTVQDYQANICHMAITLDFHNCMCQKHYWSDNDCKDINWVVVKLSMGLQAQWIHHTTQVSCDWLPLLGSSPMARPNSSKLCPLYQRVDDTSWHFLECKHPECTSKFLQLWCQSTFVPNALAGAGGHLNW